MANRSETVILSVHEVEDRLEEAALTMKRLPNTGGPKGYGSSWPDYVRSRWTAYGFEQARVRVIPNAKEIQRMDEAIDWLRLITHEDEARAAQDRRIVWMRAEQMPWRAICSRVGLSRSQAWRRWTAALITVQKRLEKPRRQTRKGGGRAGSTLNAEGGGRRGTGGEKRKAAVRPPNPLPPRGRARMPPSAADLKRGRGAHSGVPWFSAPSRPLSIAKIANSTTLGTGARPSA